MLLEAHLFDFDGDLYGREPRWGSSRGCARSSCFESMDAMVSQMHRDADEARRILGA